MWGWWDTSVIFQGSRLKLLVHHPVHITCVINTEKDYKYLNPETKRKAPSIGNASVCKICLNSNCLVSGIRGWLCIRFKEPLGSQSAGKGGVIKWGGGNPNHVKWPEPNNQLFLPSLNSACLPVNLCLFSVFPLVRLHSQSHFMFLFARINII